MMLLQPGAGFAGRYEIVRVLSTGGMGVVYEVLHRDTQRKRALKLMLPSLLADDDMRARFSREATVTASIESEHLVEVFDAGVDRETGCPFLVMELLRGEDLSARLNRGERTSPRDVLTIFEQLTRAIVRTHESGIIHRDLKPENIFVTKRDDGSLRMKILDFGIAKLVDRGGKSTRSVGTPIYMAPEQMTGKGIDAASDLYALGQIAFTLLVGQPYFMREAETAENVMSLMYAVGTGTVDPASLRGRELGVELPAAFDAWFARATHRDVASRFASATQQLDALHGVLDSAPDVLPVSSGAVRREAAFGATEAMSPGSPGGGASAEAAPPLAPAAVDRSAGPARTHLSAPALSPPASASAMSNAAGVSSAQMTGGPSSRTLGGDTDAKPRSRLGVIAIAAGVVTVAAVAIGVAVRSSDSSDSSDSATVASPSSSALPEAPNAAPSATSAEPQVAPSADASSQVAAPAPAPSAVAPATSASVATGPARPGPVPGARSAPKPSAAPPPTSAPAASTAASPSVPPAGTVWAGPRR